MFPLSFFSRPRLTVPILITSADGTELEFVATIILRLAVLAQSVCHHCSVLGIIHEVRRAAVSLLPLLALNPVTAKLCHPLEVYTILRHDRNVRLPGLCNEFLGISG